MSLAEIKSEICRMTPESRREIARLLSTLDERDPEWESMISRRLASAETGNIVAQSDIETLHARLAAEGR
jgi:hypothetical protein